MLKFNKMVYYALKGMLTEDANNLDVIARRLNFAAMANGGLCKVLFEGIAIDVKTKDQETLQAYLDKYYGVERVTEISVTLSTNESFEQYINIACNVNGKKQTKMFCLDSITEELLKLFKVEYV